MVYLFVLFTILLSIRFFFFYCSGDHCYLHSFPTRRSSDLSPAHSRQRQLQSDRGGGPGVHRRRRSRLHGAQRSRSHRGLSRSEEHTSELQSPCNLVCRLLLEKKKQ